MRQRDKEVQEQERTDRIDKSRSAKRYKDIRVMGIPRYLKGKRGRAGGKVRRIARLRCGNEELGNRYWAKDKSCRICKEEEENLEHLTRRCRGMAVWEGEIKDLLGDDGKGERWARELEKAREKIKEEGHRKVNVIE